jgi:hypothetical protein
MDYKQQQDIIKYLAKLEKQLIKVYGDTYKAAIDIADVRKAIESDDTFSWNGNRQAAAKLDKMLQQLTHKVETLIANGIGSCYRQGERSVTGDVIKALGVRGKAQAAEVTAICDAATDQRRAHGQSAAAHINARRGGIQASAQIWQQNAKKEIEIIVQNGMKEGKSPSEIAQSIRGYLKEPYRYEKSVYNPTTGRLERSEAAKDYHPGQGVYRSSYKNALRMARTEMTQAYRQAEWESYQNNPLIKAYEIRLSGNHTTMKTVKGKRVPVPLTDICDKLAGVYPKTFKWVGWHPQCRCLMIPIMVDKKEFRELLEARKADREAKRAGKEATAVAKINQRAANVPLPKKFTDWMNANQERINIARKNGSNIPMWITDNVNMPTTITAVTATGTVTTPVATPQTVELKPEDVLKTGDPRPVCKQSAEIMQLKTYDELEKYVAANDLADTFGLKTVPFEYARETCAIWAQYKHDWNLNKIGRICTARMGSNVFAHACGSYMELNPSFFNKANAPVQLPRAYKNDVVNYLADKKQDLAARKATIEHWEKKQKDAYYSGDKRSYNAITSLLDRYRKEYAKVEKIVNAGITRFNVFYSEKTVLRNTAQHEFGHVVDDKLLGSINGRLCKIARIPDATALTMRTKWNALYAKYKDNCGWLSEYGTTKSGEFLAECMVVYMEKGGAGLPLEIKQWFDELKKLANATP